jgi:hypothetical protein
VGTLVPLCLDRTTDTVLPGEFGARAGGGSEETPRTQNRATPYRGLGGRVPAVQRRSVIFDADRYRDPAPGQGDRRAPRRESSRTQNRRSLSGRALRPGRPTNPKREPAPGCATSKNPGGRRPTEEWPSKRRGAEPCAFLPSQGRGQNMRVAGATEVRSYGSPRVCLRTATVEDPRTSICSRECRRRRDRLASRSCQQCGRCITPRSCSGQMVVGLCPAVDSFEAAERLWESHCERRSSPVRRVI